MAQAKKIKKCSHKEYETLHPEMFWWCFWCKKCSAIQTHGEGKPNKKAWQLPGTGQNYLL